MFKTKTKAMSLFLTLVMTLSLAVPAFAANGQVNISFADGSSTTLVNTSDIELHEVGATAVDTVTVSDGTITDTYSDFTQTIDKTLTGGTRYQIYMKTDSNGIKTLRFKYLNTLNDTIYITVADKEVSYSVNANSGAYGQNNNLGGTATCTTTGDNVTTVKGGSGYSITYSPKSGQEITKLNLRVDAADGTGKIVDATAGTVTVGGQTFKITTAANGKVTVSTSSTVRNLFITALTKDETTKYTLSASTNGNCTASLSSEQVAQGTSKSITFTPASGYMVSDITISSGGKTGKIAIQSSSVTVNGKTYTVSRSLDGSAILSVPAMAADVSVSAVAASDINYIKVSESSNVESNKAGVYFLQDGSSFEFYYTPDSGAEIRTITIKTPSLGEKTYTVNSTGTVYGSDGDFFYYYNGKYYNGTYWEDFYHGDVHIYCESDGDVRVRIDNVSENMEFTVNGKDYVHEIEINTDSGVDVAYDAYTVDDGDDLDLVFTPTKSTYEIQTIKVKYDGSTYTADVDDDTYIRVDGKRWYISESSSGIVTLSMTDIEEDVTVTVSSNYSSLNNLRITKSADTHSNISYTGSNPFDADESTTVRVYADNNYVLSKVTFKIGTKSVSVEPFDTTFTLSGNTYNVNWVDSSEFSVYFPYLPGNLTVTSKSVKGTAESVPGTTVTPSGYHAGYMFGYGNGYFGPNDNLTRAQAVVMLNRAIVGVSDSTLNQYKYNQRYADVQSTAWYAGAVNYASAMGYLDILSTSGNRFNPDTPITRAEYLALLCEYQNISVSGTSSASKYTDVSSSYWAAKYINYATNQGWVAGYGNGYFGPDRSVTRAEICIMTNHVLGRTADASVVAASAPIFNDVPIGFWAYNDIFEASHNHYATTYSGYEVWSW